MSIPYSPKRGDVSSRVDLIVPDATWGTGAFTHIVHCPFCGYDYTHPQWTKYVTGHPDYTPGPNRGAQIVSQFWCENGCLFRLVFGFHKGQTFVRAEYVGRAQESEPARQG